MAKLTARAVESTFKDKEGNTVYRMIVSANGKVDTAEIAQSTADDTRMAAPLVKAISEAFSGQMVAALANGYRIDTDYFTIGFRVLGRFNGPEDAFDPKRHSLELSFQMKSKAKKMLSDLEVVNILSKIQLSITAVRCEGVEAADTIKANANVYVTGKNTKIETSRSDEGVTLVDGDGAVVATATVTESDIGTIVAKFESAIEPGDYTLSVTGRNGGDASLTPITAKRAVKVIA